MIPFEELYKGVTDEILDDVVSDMPPFGAGAAAIGDRIANPLQDDDEQRRAAATARLMVLLRLRQLFFAMVRKWKIEN